jgi:hypothetical protein
MFWGGFLPYRTVEEQDVFSRRFINVSRGSVGGWLNWPLQDTRKANDTSEYGGFFTSTGELKPWGRSFRAVSSGITRRRAERTRATVIIPASRKKLLTDWALCERILERTHQLHLQGRMWDFELTE